MKEIVLISGARGMVAKQLAKVLQPQYSVRFLTRKGTKKNEFKWDVENNIINPIAFEGVNHIVHLAGASVATKRWTKNRKTEILASRIDSANLLMNELKKQNIVVNTFISASAIGYYGNKTTKEIYTEESPSAKDFLSNVCQKWEFSAKSFKANNTAERVSVLRIGMVLSKEGGILKRIMPLTKFYLSSAFGNGKQYNPWIHIDDLCGIIQYIIGSKTLSGTFNAVAPEHITNKDLIRAIAENMNKTLILPNIPGFIIRLVMGEMSSLFLNGTRISSRKIIKSGYDFKYPELKSALKNIIK